MNKGINFLKEKAEIIKKKRRRGFLINFASFVLVVVYVLGLMSLFSFYFVQRKESEVLEQKINSKKQEIKNFQPIETKQFYLKNKLSSLVKVLASQRENQRIVEAVFNLLPEGVAVNSLAIDQKGGVSFAASTKKLSTLKSFLANLEQQPEIVGLKVSDVVIESVSFRSKSGYSLKIYLLLNG